jgi:hypothetical protein
MATYDLFENLFDECAWAAYLDQMQIEQSWSPDSEATRPLAYRYYEQTLAEKNQRRAEASAEVSKALTMPPKRAKAEA